MNTDNKEASERLEKSFGKEACEKEGEAISISKANVTSSARALQHEFKNQRMRCVAPNLWLDVVLN